MVSGPDILTISLPPALLSTFHDESLNRNLEQLEAYVDSRRIEMRRDFACDIFTEPRYPRWLDRLPEAKAFAVIIDSYRLRKNDEHKFGGNSSGLYNNGEFLVRYSSGNHRSYCEEDPLPDFQHFLNQAEACGDVLPVLPSWWNQDKRRACETLALTDEWYNINSVVDRRSISWHNGAIKAVLSMKLRILADRVTGSILDIKCDWD